MLLNIDILCILNVNFSMFLCVTELEKDRITVLSLGEIRYGENEIILYLFPNGRTVLGRSVIYNNSPGFNFFQK